MASGRKKDPIWIEFTEMPSRSGISGIRVMCNTCKKEMQGIASRLKKHKQSQCFSPSGTNLVSIQNNN